MAFLAKPPKQEKERRILELKSEIGLLLMVLSGQSFPGKVKGKNVDRMVSLSVQSILSQIDEEIAQKTCGSSFD